MDCFKFLISILVSVLVLGGCAHPVKSIPRDIASLKANGGMVGIWFLQGTSSTRGPYNGEFELRPASDGTFNVTRVVTYINYFYEGLRVQEVWTGKAVADNDTLTVTYDLKQGEFITKFDGLAKSVKELQTPLTINLRFFPATSGLTAKFSDKRVSEYSEWLTTKGPLEAEPLWVADRQFVAAIGNPVPASERKLIKSAQANLNYAKDPFVQSYKNNPDFKLERASIVVDKSDLKFYKENKDIIRLVNKVTDDATISESAIKRNAYFPSLGDKAIRYDDSTVARNFSSADLIVVRKMEGENLTIHNQDVDSAFTTGMYIASQAMRYQVTKDGQSVLNIRRALHGLNMLAEISKDKTQIATAISPIVKEIPENWVAGSGSFQKYMWTTANQEQALLGMIHGLTWVSVSLPKTEKEIWNFLSVIVQDLNKKSNANLSVLTQNSLRGLSAYVLNDRQAEADFLETHPPKNSFYWAGNADWNYEFQSLIETINHLQLAKALGNSALADEWRNYLSAEWSIYAPAQRTLRTLVTYGFSAQDNGSAPSDVAAAIPEAVRALSEVPYPRTRMDATIDHSGDTSWVLSPIPKNYWNVQNKNKKAVQNYYQGLQELPIFELHAATSRFIWKEDAFQFQGKANKDIEATGVDYLYGYWLARFVGAPDVQ